MASQKMFTDLEQLIVGDVFYLHVLNEILAYQVIEINTVLPYDTSLLGIEHGEDFCTLVTCTPYGVNTHRLLVRGSRIPYEEAEAIVEEIQTEELETSAWEQQYIRGLVIGLGAAAASTVLVLLIVAIRKRKKRGGNYAKR
jgi:sortase A